MADIARVFPATIELASVAILIGTSIGIPLGVLAAMYRGSWVDQVVRVVGLIGYLLFGLGYLAMFGVEVVATVVLPASHSRLARWS